MSSLLESIVAVGVAADALSLSCATHVQIVVDPAPSGFGPQLRRAFTSSMFAPADMVSILKRTK